MRCVRLRESGRELLDDSVGQRVGHRDNLVVDLVEGRVVVGVLAVQTLGRFLSRKREVLVQTVGVAEDDALAA